MSVQVLSTAGAVLRSNEQVIQIFETTTALYGFPTAEQSSWAKGDVIAITLGGSVKFDGTYGVWAWNPASTAADDGVNVVLPTAFTTPDPGRWILIACECGGRAPV